MLNFGTDDQRQIYTRNENGIIIKSEFDLTNDDSIDKSEVYKVNSLGQVIETTFYFGDTATRKEIYTLNSYHQRVKVEVDLGANDVVDSITTNTFDALGRVITSGIDIDANNSIDQWYYNSYDANNNLVLQETDLTNTGSVTAKTLREYDALGRVTKQYIDSDNNGSYNSSSTNTYDVYGRLIKAESDTDNDGNPNVINYFTYDSNGLRTTLWIDRTANGDTSDDSKYQYTYDDAGRLIAEIQTSSGTSTNYTYEYDELGRRSASYQYVNGQQTAVFTYEYLGSTDKVLKMLASYTNGFVRSVENEYNDALQIIHAYSDDRNNGSIEMLTFGDFNGSNTISYSTDLSQWSEEKLAKLGTGLTTIRLSNASFSSTLSIDNETIAKISNGGLRIEGDATDTVNLTGLSKSIETRVVGNHTYNVYTGDANGETLSVLIDNDIMTNIVG